jgi:hypothetical protein
VLTAVDAALRANLPVLRGFRYLDDYEAAFATRAEAEEAQGHLESALGDYELVVNPFKTYVLELPQPFNATWKRELASFPIRNGTPTQTLNDTIALFSRAAEVGTRHPGALLYALRKCNSIPPHLRTWATFEGLVWSVVSVEPTTMAVALDLLTVKAAQAGASVRKAAAAEVIESLIHRHAPLRNSSEVAWAIWAAIALEVDLTAIAAQDVASMEDDFVALLALHADSSGRFPAGALDKTNWETLINYDAVLKGDHWLLAYESTRKNWLTSAQPRVAADPFFSILLKGGVYFYDENPVRDPFTGPAAPLPGTTIPESYF